MVTTTPHRVRAVSREVLVVESALSCSARAGPTTPHSTEAPLQRQPDTDGWSICFDSRGLASANMTLTLEHPRDGSRRIEVLRGGTLRRGP